jgi:hypothetical protein
MAAMLLVEAGTLVVAGALYERLGSTKASAELNLAAERKSWEIEKEALEGKLDQIEAFIDQKLIDNTKLFNEWKARGARPVTIVQQALPANLVGRGGGPGGRK